MAFIGLPNVEVCWPSPSYKHVGTNIYLETAVGRLTGYENGITFCHPLFVFPVLPTVPPFRFINRVGRACWTSSLEICIIIFHHFHIITFSLLLSFRVFLFQADNDPKHKYVVHSKLSTSLTSTFSYLSTAKLLFLKSLCRPKDLLHIPVYRISYLKLNSNASCSHFCGRSQIHNPHSEYLYIYICNMQKLI